MRTVIEKVSVHPVLSGMVAYRVLQKSKAKGVSPTVIAKELMINALKAEGLLAPNYTLSDMRQGF